MPKRKRWYIIGGAIVLVAAVFACRCTGLAVLATTAEKSRTYPGDALLPKPAATVMHAITIQAPPACIWPWLAQMGSGRAGWYSYDWVDNDNQPSASTIIPSLQRVKVGDVFPALPGVKTSFVVGAVEPERDLALTVPAANGGLIVVWEFYLLPGENQHTRLIMNGRVAEGWPGGSTGKPSGKGRPIEGVYAILEHLPHWLMVPMAEFGHGVMAASQLRHIKERVETSGCAKR